MKLKQYEIVTQPEYLKSPLQDILRKYRTIKQWAYILHDKDDDATPHFHIYVNFGSTGVDSKDVAAWFGISENFINKIEGRKVDMLLYLTHGQESQQHKHQYDFSEVRANFDFKSEIEQSKIIGDFKKYSYAQQLDYIHSLAVSEQPKCFDRLQKLWKMQCQWLSLNADRDLKVIFVTGKSGTGKTYFARKYMREHDLDYYVSSSSNDPLDMYMGQKGIIFDDLRDEAFEFPDILKLLDNNTATAMKSRFSNKVLNCKVMILTSFIPIKYWYKAVRYSSDGIEQLYRRIGTYIQITEDEIIVYDGVTDKGDPQGLGKVYINEVKKLKEENIRQKKSVFEDFDSFLTSKSNIF